MLDRRQPNLQSAVQEVTQVAERELALRVANVDCSYGQLQVLFDVSLEVLRGEALALLGTNGAGKSTLLRVVAGLEQPSRGLVELDDLDLSRVPAERRVEKGLVLVVGGRGVFSDLSVDDNLELQSLTAGLSSAEFKERLDDVLTTFPRLAERRRQKAGMLSGGEQQQVALAKALLLEPRLLCIDELSLGLAPVVVGELLDVVRRIHARGVSLIVVEQSLNIAAELCDRAVFLEKGEVKFEGATRDLLERGDIARSVFLGADPVS
jgi:ABC-type branched-subunit amino acid transport system ATPase component